MAPGRKRGAKGVKTKSELNLGDLVLAKVKGFPFWPAKIGQPEDWQKAPDPKKYFVEFFGTGEIAFVAPADIQAFTIETKNRLAARCQGKTKLFAQAVTEICEEFDLLQCKNTSSIRNDNIAQNLESNAHSVDPVIDEASEVSAEDGIDSAGPNHRLEINGLSKHGSEFGHSQNRQEMELQDLMPCSSDGNKHGSPAYVSPVKKSKLSENPSNHSKDSVLGSVKKEGSHNVKAELGCSDGGQSELTNGDRSKPAVWPKRKNENTVCRKSSLVISPEHKGDGKQNKCDSGGKTKVLSADSSRLGSDLDSERKEKKLPKEKNNCMTLSGRENAEVTEDHSEVVSRKKVKFQHDHGKLTSRTMEASYPAKKSKTADVLDGAKLQRAQAIKRNPISPVDPDDKKDGTEYKRLTQGGKADSHQSFRAHTSNNELSRSISEDDLPPRKPHSRTGEMMSASASISENINGNTPSCRNGSLNPNKVRPSSVQQQLKKRRALRICYDDDEELPKTPVHGGSSHSKVSANSSRLSESKKKIVAHGEGYGSQLLVLGNSAKIEVDLKGQEPSSRLSNKISSPIAAQKGSEKRSKESSAENLSPNHRQLDAEKLLIKETKPVKDSSPLVAAVRSLTEPRKKNFSSKTPVSTLQKKFPSGANRGLNTASNGSEPNQSINKKSRLSSPREKRKTTSLPGSQMNGYVPLAADPDESVATPGGKLDVGKDPKTGFLVNSKISDSVTSIKHLIAAAQARKKQANIQNSCVNHIPLGIPDTHIFGGIPDLTPGTLAAESNTALHLDVQILHSNPPSDVRQFPSVNEHENDEFEDRRVSSSHRATGSSLSGDTEAVVARDAFEGMIETLSRTKDSIGRATRQAIDCAKYGIANEVVDLLVRKLENELRFHRRVDLFFLVDSITQCSHSQKGIAGASYIPIVQAALPRLIEAAAPSGPDAHENRRQCHKVLRLWLERKIFPESVLRHHMDGIGSMNDDKSTLISQKRPSRSERSIDDPIRDMEGMLVDEYGSNATFQLPGFLLSNFFEEEEDEDNILTGHKEVPDTSPSDHNNPASRDLENCSATPSDRRHCILEDVDGELEMEDVSARPKDEGTFCGEVDPNSNEIFQSTSSMSEPWPPSPEGTPPLPPGSPPPSPPLPSSPPPPPPPSSCLSLPPPPPHLFPPQPVGPSPLTPQPALVPQQMPQLTSSISSSQPLSYHLPPPLPHDVGVVPTSDGYLNTKQRQPFLLDSAPYPQRPMHPESVTQLPGHFSYPNSVQQNQYPTYSSSNFPDGWRRNATDEQWRMHVNSDFGSDGARRWTGGGYFGPHPEGPPASAVSFQTPAPSSLPAAPVSGHGAQLMSSRPDVSAVNRRT